MSVLFSINKQLNICYYRDLPFYQYLFEQSNKYFSPKLYQLKMSQQQLKLLISEGPKVLETISLETLDTRPGAMVKAVNDYRLLVNNAITKLIEDHNDTCDFMEDEEGDSEDDEKDIEVSPKKRKK